VEGHFELWLEEEPPAHELHGRLLISGQPARGWMASWEDGAGAALGSKPVLTDELGLFVLTSDAGGERTLRLVSGLGSPLAPMLLHAKVRLEARESQWEQRLDLGRVLGGIAAGAPVGLYCARIELGSVTCIAPLAEEVGTRFDRRVPAGTVEIVRFADKTTLSAQVGEVLSTFLLQSESERVIEIP
jgi:hypothetical protein